ncbi:DUF5989 family protein [Phyllobacterium phragmitis]|nr:DUF5989 family protein [Phyllobacterium phragmitis]
MEFFKEFTKFLLRRKKYWIWPMTFVTVIIGGILVISSGSAVAPFIYAIF